MQDLLVQKRVLWGSGSNSCRKSYVKGFTGNPIVFCMTVKVYLAMHIQPSASADVENSKFSGHYHEAYWARSWAVVTQLNPTDIHLQQLRNSHTASDPNVRTISYHYEILSYAPSKEDSRTTAQLVTYYISLSLFLYISTISFTILQYSLIPGLKMDVILCCSFLARKQSQWKRSEDISKGNMLSWERIYSY